MRESVKCRLTREGFLGIRREAIVPKEFGYDLVQSGMLPVRTICCNMHWYFSVVCTL